MADLATRWQNKRLTPSHLMPRLIYKRTLLNWIGRRGPFGALLADIPQKASNQDNHKTSHYPTHDGSNFSSIVVGGVVGCRIVTPNLMACVDIAGTCTGEKSVLASGGSCQNPPVIQLNCTSVELMSDPL